MSKDFDIKNGCLKKYNGVEAEVVIPDYVVEIESYAFDQCDTMRTIVIPECVTRIGAYAFHCCRNLISIQIPNGVKSIEDGVFCGCRSLATVIIPNSVTEIGDWAFEDCMSLVSISIPGSVARIGNIAFEGCTSLTTMKLPYGITEICQYAFFGCSRLKSIEVPDSVKKIDYSSFGGCPLLTIVCKEHSFMHQYCLNHALNYIFDYQYQAFHGILPPGIDKLPSPFHSDEETPFVFISYSHKDRNVVLAIIKPLYESGWKIWYDEGLTVGDNFDNTIETHIKNCSVFLLFITEHSADSLYMRQYEIPWAQKYDKPIIKCILEEKVAHAFANTPIVSSVPAKEIEAALESVDGLSKGKQRKARMVSVLVNPANREVASSGLAYCLYSRESSAIARSIILEARNDGCILYDAVENGEDLAKLKRSDVFLPLIDKAFLSNKELCNTLTYAHEAGKEISVCLLENVSDYDFPESLRPFYHLHWINYYNANMLEKNRELIQHLQERGVRDTAVLPGFNYQVTDEGIVIQKYTGMDPNPRIEREYNGIPVIKIGQFAFEKCIYLEKLDIPESITHIEKGAFYGCQHLTSITLPNSVKRIGDYAFSGCSCLTTITVPNNVKQIGACAFTDCSSLITVTIPENVTVIASGTFENCKKLTSIIIPEHVQAIREFAFKGCESLISISIPKSVTMIEGFAFAYCTHLVSITIPNSVDWFGNQPWDSSVFEGCQQLTIRGKANSRAEQYASDYHIRFCRVL